MKKFLTLIFLFTYINLFSQQKPNQVIEMCEDSNKTFTYFSKGTPNCEYEWKIFEGNKLVEVFNTEKITYTFTSVSTIYTIQVYSQNTQCQSEAQTYIVETIPYMIPAVFVPNSFTPNNNNRNDGWKPVATYVEWMKTSVYNKWGNLIFNTEEFDVYWDGTFKGVDVQSDVYIYYVEYRTTKGKWGYEKGTITLYR